ncbi:FG-GAP repeat protein [Candidatus Peregrinibacteria bacterium]|nr:MAG: FG-GAP repeat protein [Candidatus Peregrinibacteria bacterium]
MKHMLFRNSILVFSFFGILLLFETPVLANQYMSQSDIEMQMLRYKDFTFQEPRGGLNFFPVFSSFFEPVFSALDTALTNKKTASDGVSYDTFGAAMAMEGDTLVVGADATEDFFTSNLGVGAVYVFEKIGGVWTETQKLTASDGNDNDHFGNSIALSGNTMFISAMTKEVGTHQSEGAVYVFEKIGGVWTETQKLTASDPYEINHFFGDSVAFDGGNYAVISAPWTPIYAVHGDAYVFEKIGGVWIEVQKLQASNGFNGDHFGIEVAMSGETIAITSWNATPSGNATYSGAIYIFTRNATTGVWEETQEVAPSTSSPGQGFGLAMNIKGNTLIAGAPFYKEGTTGDAGRVTVFQKQSGNFVETQILSPSSPTTGRKFGSSVAFENNTLLVGAYGDSTPKGSERGSAYQFELSGGTWSQQEKFYASDGAYQDRFGGRVVLSQGEAVVSAPLDDDKGTSSGSAYFLGTISTPILQTLSLTKTGTGNGTLTSAPVGIDCGATCTTSFTEGTVVTLTVSADAGSIFSGWSGDGDCSDGVITMNAPVSCTADFSLLYATPDLWTQVLGGSSIFHLLGNVGIGTSTPSEALEVVGKVKADELCIGSDCRSAWPVGAANTSSPVLFGAETVDQGTMAELLEKIHQQEEEITTLKSTFEALKERAENL